jgi:hypothetical protein
LFTSLRLSRLLGEDHPQRSARLRDALLKALNVAPVERPFEVFDGNCVFATRSCSRVADAWWSAWAAWYAWPMHATGIPIDITNRDDIRAKLPEIEKLLKVKREELAALEATYSDLRRMAGISAPSRGGLREAVKSRAETTAKKRVIGILEDAQTPMKSAEVATRLPNLKRDTVNWALWNAEREGLIQRTSQGVYAALNYDPSADTLLASANGSEESATGGDDED